MAPIKIKVGLLTETKPRRRKDGSVYYAAYGLNQDGHMACICSDEALDLEKVEAGKTYALFGCNSNVKDEVLFVVLTA